MPEYLREDHLVKYNIPLQKAEIFYGLLVASGYIDPEKVSLKNIYNDPADKLEFNPEDLRLLDYAEEIFASYERDFEPHKGRIDLYTPQEAADFQAYLFRKLTGNAGKKDSDTAMNLLEISDPECKDGLIILCVPENLSDVQYAVHNITEKDKSDTFYYYHSDIEALVKESEAFAEKTLKIHYDKQSSPENYFKIFSLEDAETLVSKLKEESIEEIKSYNAPITRTIMLDYLGNVICQFDKSLTFDETTQKDKAILHSDVYVERKKLSRYKIQFEGNLAEELSKPFIDTAILQNANVSRLNNEDRKRFLN